eukprot:GHVO01039371.1.p1 GENE.GHVO01039371.1~~GHVO01039371.1.p1  ORF type:complete len:369 (+),score=53.37 GHVO01039371.1:517-1623(+)
MYINPTSTIYDAKTHNVVCNDMPYTTDESNAQFWYTHRNSHLVNSQDFLKQIIAAVKTRKVDVNVSRKRPWVTLSGAPYGPVGIFSNAEPDGLCATHMLKEVLVLHCGINVKIIAIGGFGHIRELISGGEDLTAFSCIVFVNIGARYHIGKLIEDAADVDKAPAMFVLDTARPISHEYDTYKGKIKCKLVMSQIESEGIENPSTNMTPKFRGGGEYHTVPSSLVTLEALRAQNFEASHYVLLSSTGCASHYINESCSKDQYDEYSKKLKNIYTSIKQRSWREDRTLEQFRFDEKELLLPLVRFSSVEESIKTCVPFIRMQHRDGFSRDVTEDLATIRVDLDLHAKSWSERFRLLPQSDQRRLLRNKIA